MAREISKQRKSIFKLSRPPVCRLGDVDKPVAEFLMGIEGAATWLLALVACAFGPVNVSLGVLFYILKTWEAAKSEPCQENVPGGYQDCHSSVATEDLRKLAGWRPGYGMSMGECCPNALVSEALCS